MWVVLLMRRSILDRLTTDELGPEALADELDPSRSTIDRALSELGDAGLIERVNGRYGSTVAGTLALEEIERLADRLTTAVSLSVLLAPVPADASIEPRFLEDCDVVVSSRAPLEVTRADDATVIRNVRRLEPARALEELLATGTSRRAVVPAVDRHLVTAYRDAIRDGLSVTVTLPSAAIRTLVTDRYQPTAAALETGRLTIRETDAPLPCALIVAESVDTDDGLVDGSADAAAILAIRTTDELRGLVVNETPAAFEWATATLEAVRERSRPLPSLSPES